MTLGEILASGLALQSFGIVGLLLEKDKARPAEPAPQLPAEQIREVWRQQHGVRAVQPQFEGFGIAQVPAGSYGYTYAPASASPLFARRGYQSFEMHKTLDGTAYLIGCLTPAESAQVTEARSAVEVRLCPEPHGEAQQTVCLPLDRVERKSSNPTHEDGGWVPLVVLPV